MKQNSTPLIGNAGRSRTLQALWLALANLLSLSVTLVMQAVLCRCMTTSEYGTYSQVLYVYNTLLAVFSLGLPKAYSYYLARVSPEEGRDIVRKLNGLFLLLASIFSCILLWQAAAIAGVLGNPLLAQPLRLFAAAGVLLPEFSRMSGEGADGGQFVRLWQAAVLKSSAIIYPLSVFCCVFAPEIICLLYGEGYREAAGLFRIVTLVNLARIMPYAPVLFALGRGNAFARAHLVTALLIVGLELWCVMAFPSLWAIAAIATGCTLFCLFLLMTATARVLGTSLAGLMPWRMLTTVLLVSAAACTAARLAVLLTGMTHRLAVVSVGFAVYLSLYLPFAQRAGIRYMELFGPVLAKLRPNRT